MEKDLLFYPYKQIANSALEENAFSQCINVINDRELASVNYASELLSLDSDVSFTWTIETPYTFITLSDLTNNWLTGTPVQFTSTGTLPAGLNVDQSQTTQNATVAVGEANATTKYNKISQSFIAGRTSISGVKLYKSANTGTFTGNVVVALYADSSGSPTGSALATVTISNATYNALSVGEFTATFNQAYTTTVGTTYHIVITPSTSDTSNHPNLGTNSAGGYTSGSVKFNNTADGWVAIATIDLYFKIIIPSDFVYYLRKTGDATFGIYPTFLDAKNNTNIITISDAGTGVHTATKVALTKIVGIDGAFLLDDSGNLWQIDSTYAVLRLISKGSGSGYGLRRYGLYIYLFRTSLDRYHFVTGVLTTNWQSDTITSSILSIDDNTLYLVHANEVASYDGTTYNSSALDLPTNVNISAISELGNYLVLGTDQNKLYLWDKNFDTYESPISFPNSIKMLISANNVVYVVLESGDIYVTNGTTSAIFREFPRHILSNKENPDFIFSPAGFRINNNAILIGFGSTSNVFPIGIYEIDLKTADIRIAHISSTGNVGGDDTRVEITAIRPIGAFYFGWQTYNATDGYAYGLDAISTDTRYTSAISYSPFYKIGTKRNPRTLRQFEISLGEKLRTGQSLILSYRTDLSGSWTSIGTMNEVSTISKVLDKAITCENLQFKLEITTNGDYTPYVREVRAYA